MLPVTQDFLDAVASGGRIVGRVTVDYTDPFMDQSIEVTASENANSSYPAQTADAMESVPYKWASLDGSWTLDGTWHLMPGPEDADRYQVGWWGQQLAGAGGAFSAPYPTLTVTHLPRPIHSLKVVGDDARQEWPVDFVIRLYSESNVLLHTEQVTGNTQIRWEKALTVPVLDVARQELEITRWSHQGRQVKIIEFFTSVQQTYESSDLVEISLLEERDVSAGGLPVGSISSNEISVRIRNDDRRFDVDNSQSPLYRLLKPNRRIRAWLGTVAENQATENPPVFTRASVAYLPDGTEVGPGVPRFVTVDGRKGLMVEEGTTNEILWSEKFDNAYWDKQGSGTGIASTVTADAGAAPNGTTTADRVVFNKGTGTTSSDWSRVESGTSITSNTVYAFSVWMKSYSGQTYTVALRIGSTVKVVTVDGTWRRFEVVRSVPDSDNSRASIWLRGSSGTSDTADILVWGAQLEKKPYATTYMATTSAAATRAAETLTVPTAGVLQPQEGTIEFWAYVNAQVRDTSRVRRFFSHFNGAGNANRITIQHNNNPNWVFTIANSAGSAHSLFVPDTYTPDGWHYVAMVWSASRFAVFIDGVKRGELVNPTYLPQSLAPTFDIGHTAGSSQPNTLIGPLRISRRARTDQEIAAAYAAGRFERDEDTTYLLTMNGSIYPVEQVWVPLGVFWSTEWQAPEDKVHATVVARDRLELLRKSTFASSYVRQNWDLCDLATEVLRDAGLVEGEDFFVCPSLHGIVVPYAWLEPVSHREALQLIAEAALGTVYCDRNGRIVVHTIYDLGQEPVLEIGPSQYFRVDAPMRPGEVANEVIVWTSPLQPAAAPEEVYRSNEPITVEAGQVARLTAYYNERPVIDATAILVGATATLIQDAQYYGWGAEITLYNPSATDESVTVVIEGKPLRVRNREVAIARDEQSIREHGVLRYEVADNPLIQTREVAQRLADLILASAKDPRRDLEMEWRGNPAVELGDRIKVKGLDYHVISNELTWTGGLRARTVGRRAI